MDTGDWAKDPLKATSNGPFLLDTYTKDEGMVLIKNPNYINAEETSLQKIYVYFEADSLIVLDSFKEGDIDVFDVPPVEK